MKKYVYKFPLYKKHITQNSKHSESSPNNDSTQILQKNQVSLLTIKQPNIKNKSSHII